MVDWFKSLTNRIHPARSSVCCRIVCALVIDLIHRVEAVTRPTMYLTIAALPSAETSAGAAEQALAALSIEDEMIPQWAAFRQRPSGKNPE
jgi:hypothetical protein